MLPLTTFIGVACACHNSLSPPHNPFPERSPPIPWTQKPKMVSDNQWCHYGGIRPQLTNCSEDRAILLRRSTRGALSFLLPRSWFLISKYNLGQFKCGQACNSGSINSQLLLENRTKAGGKKVNFARMTSHCWCQTFSVLCCAPCCSIVTVSIFRTAGTF